jgi:hypothetical protein
MSDARRRKTAAHGVANWILPVPQFRIPEIAKIGGGGRDRSVEKVFVIIVIHRRHCRVRAMMSGRQL